ncbi:MAG: Nif11-like leader peptide family RiPP precursor [Actinomycetota bacterium]
MSDEQAAALVRRVLEDPEFARRLEATPFDERRALLRAEGYGDVRLRHVASALPESVGGELSDDEFAAVAGGNALTGAAISAGATVGSVTIIATVAMAF